VDLRFHVKERPAISAVEFEGNDEIDDDDLAEAIEVKVDTILSRPALRRAVQKIRDMYAEQGYMSRIFWRAGRGAGRLRIVSTSPAARGPEDPGHVRRAGLLPGRSELEGRRPEKQRGDGPVHGPRAQPGLRQAHHLHRQRERDHR